jgi:hypothetical protein
MPGRLSTKSNKNGQLRHCLTEENLRLHSYTFPQVRRVAHGRQQSRLTMHPQRSTATPPTNALDQEHTWGQTFEPYYQHDAFEGSDDDDDDWEANKVDIALRRAASLEALKIYGGCFTSGFLAMQDPLPWMTPSNGSRKPRRQDVEGLDLRRLASEMVRSRSGNTETSSRDSDSRIGSPRPDSDTLSRADVEKERGRKWSWRSLGKRRSDTPKHACL